jgi:hypothetical protein
MQLSCVEVGMGDLGAGYGRFFHLLFHFQVEHPKLLSWLAPSSMHRILRLVLRLLAVSVVSSVLLGSAFLGIDVQRST